MVVVLRKIWEFGSIFFTIWILLLGKATGTQVNISKNASQSKIVAELVEQSTASIMEIQLLPESYNIQAPPSHREFSGEEKINPQLVNSSPQKITITPCIDKELTCKFSQASDIYPSQPSVHQLSDIQPTDWAYLAIKSLIERHQLQLDIYFGNKLDGTRTLTRYEFAAITNDVISKISPKISASNSSNSQIYLTQSELQALQKIQTEFNSELSNLNNRIDKLERRVSENISQFSSTTKFTGEALFAVSAAATNENQQGNLTFGYRTRLNFNSSFTGKDSLRIRLQARNLPRFDDITDTDMARLSYQGGDNNNRIEISRLDYSFPINKQLQIKVPVVGGSLRDFTDPLNPYLAGSSRGAISRFAQRNPIYRHGRGSGIGFSYEISDALEFEAGFLARDANNPETGFTKGAYGAIAQITIEPVEDMEFAFSYIRSYNNIDTGTGSEAANDPFDDNSNAVLANSFGIQSAIKISPNFTLAGWIGYTNATALDLPNNPNANILNWAITLAFPDLGGKGNLAGFVIGQPPKVIDSDFIDDDNNKISDLEPDTSLHLEGFYRWQVQENIGISLGLLTIINPEHNSENNTVYVGSLRTTFSF